MNAPMRDQNAQAARTTPAADDQKVAVASATAPARKAAARKGERSVLLRYGAVVAVVATCWTVPRSGSFRH